MRDRSQARCVLVQPQVATVLVIVADVSSHEPDEMTCAENHDVLKKLATAAADPVLCQNSALLKNHVCNLMLSIIIINPGLDSRARTALEHMLESVVSARGKVLRTNFSATSRVTRATKLTQAASRHSYRWCSPPTRGSATTFAVGDGRCVTALKLGVSLFSPKWQRSS